MPKSLHLIHRDRKTRRGQQNKPASPSTVTALFVRVPVILPFKPTHVTVEAIKAAVQKL